MIFLAGATGFIGRHVAEELRARGYSVRCLLRPDSDKDPARRQRERQRLEASGFQTVTGNVCDHDQLAVLMDGCSAVVNLVGATPQTARGQRSFHVSHVESTQRLLEAAESAGRLHFVQMSVLGAAPDSMSSFHRSKWESDKLVRASSVPWSILRASVVVGAGDVFTNTIIDLLEKPLVAPVPCDGETRLQPVAATDVARAISCLLARPEPRGEIFNCAGAVQMRFSEMVDAVGTIYGSQSRKIRIPPTVARPWAFIRQTLRSKRAMTLEQIRIITTDSICDFDEVRRHFAWEFTPYEAAVRDAIAARVAAEAHAEATVPA